MKAALRLVEGQVAALRRSCWSTPGAGTSPPRSAGSRCSARRRGPARPAGHRRLRRPGLVHGAVQRARRGRDRRAGRGLRDPLLRRDRRPQRPGDQDPRRLGAVPGVRPGAGDRHRAGHHRGDRRRRAAARRTARAGDRPGRAPDGRRLRPAGEPGRPVHRGGPPQPGDHRRSDRRAAAARRVRDPAAAGPADPRLRRHRAGHGPTDAAPPTRLSRRVARRALRRRSP